MVNLPLLSRYVVHLLFILINSVLLVTGCSPKTNVPVTTPTEKAEEKITDNAPVLPCVTFDDLPGHEREVAMTAYVLYKDYMKSNRLDEALPIWRQAFTMAPASNGRVKSQFDDGVKLYKYLYEKETDAKKKKLWVDTIYMIYDKRSYCFGEEAYVNGLKAFDGYYYFGAYFDSDTVFQWFKKHVDVKGIRSDYFVVNPFAKMLYDKVTQETLQKDEGLHYAKLVNQIVEHGITTCKEKQCETWKIINDYAPVQMELLEGVEDFYDCDYYVEKYYNLYRQYPDSCDIINIACARLNRGGCDPDRSELKTLAEVKSKKCYTAPESPGLAKQGYDAYTRGKYKEAIQKFEQFADESDDKGIKAKYYLLISKIYYGDLKNFSRSRQYAREAARFRPNWGEPYMLIGKLYASSGPLCGPGTGWDSQVVTWVAIDQFQYAKSVDPSVTAEANQWIARYSQYMPSSEDLFFRSIKKGSKYFVPCWIQEETVVRSAD
jgi:tetratricopeptide (TPR) repeat protein